MVEQFRSLVKLRLPDTQCCCNGCAIGCPC